MEGTEYVQDETEVEPETATVRVNPLVLMTQDPGGFMDELEGLCERYAVSPLDWYFDFDINKYRATQRRGQGGENERERG